MTISFEDVSFVLSGGINNISPNGSLGGFPSPTPILADVLDNLFLDISPQDAAVGKTDYRCFYIFNDNSTDTMHNFSIWLDKIGNSATDIKIGILLRNEIQIISIAPPGGSPIIDSGTFKIVLGTLLTSPIAYDINSTTLAANIQTAMRAILEDNIDVNYTGISEGGASLYLVSFYGVNKNKAFSLIQFQNNTTLQTLSATKSQTGSPVNTIATDIGDEKLAPINISFTNPTRPGLSIGDLLSSEGFPVWVRRIVPFSSEAVDGDGFFIRCLVTT